VDDQDECAEGATVTLFNSTNEKIDESSTDNYGDFKFDDLEENSGRYILQVALAGYDTKTVEAELTKSLNLGIIQL
jgi:hypothetical protein